MKKVISVLLIAIVILTCIFALTACSPANRIVGTWKISSIDLTYGDQISDIWFDTDCNVTFNKDGTVTNEYKQTAYWRYDKKTKEYNLCDSQDFKATDIENAYIDKNGILHIDCFTYKKAK